MGLRPSTDGDHAAIRALLQDSGLPVADLDTVAVDFVVVFDGAGLAGIVGVERFDDVGLLRSLAVCAEQRGHGIGEQLLAAAEAGARASGVRQLVLLTQTAAPFFARRGYDVLAREAAPAGVQSSAEFRSLCPASATCMAKSMEFPS